MKKNIRFISIALLIVTGKFYGDFLKERISKPLGNDTGRVISEADIVANRAAGYVLAKCNSTNIYV